MKKDTLSRIASVLSKDYAVTDEDLLDERNHYSIYRIMDGCRTFDVPDDVFLKILAFNGKIVATGKEEAISFAEEAIGERRADWIMDAGRLQTILDFITARGRRLEMIHPFFVKDEKTGRDYSNLDYRFLDGEQIEMFRGKNIFQEAFAFSPDAPDEMGAVVLEDGRMAAAAGASSDSAVLWQIGVDVLAEYRGRGYGSAVVDTLSDKVIDRGLIPFYGTSFSHIASQRIALSAGFRPMWTEMIAH
ncbi:MAG: GNAT family N-acetyltransferase [Candidatus Ornithospirochaeta sp.]